MEYMLFGVYTCVRCRQRYIVNDGTWNLCTPDLCQRCNSEVEAIKEAQRCKDAWHKADDKPLHCPTCREKRDESPIS